MAIWRRWIFPILMIMVFGAIAVALLRLAFFPAADGTEAAPGVKISAPSVEVQQASVSNELTLQGSIARDDDHVVRSTANGTVTAVHVKPGATLTSGQRIATAKLDDPVKFVEITAPAAGQLTESNLFVGQVVSIGEEIGKIQSELFHVMATVEPVQLYRLVGAPDAATVQITGGPAPFSCTRLSTETSEAGTTSVRCRVPNKETVFPGLPAKLTISMGVAEDVLTVPTTAVRGGSGTGVVWVDAGDGSAPTERSITLGLSDGENVEVRKGLAAGELVLQFVPGSEAPLPEENCYEIAPGQMQCDAGTSW